MAERTERSLTVCLLAVGLLLLARGDAHASRLFFSTSANAPAEVAGQVNPSISVAENSTVSLYLWWQPSNSDAIDGLGHSVQLSNSILTRVGYVIDNPTVSGAARWSDPTDAGQSSATFLVQDAGAFNLSGSSFGSDGAADPYYDAASNSYRFSSLQFQATGVGTADLSLAVGQQGIAFDGQPPATLVNFGFGDAGVAGNDFGAAGSMADAIVTVVAADPTKPWQNPVNPLDVNGDGLVSPLDVLIIIDELNANMAHSLPVPPLAGAGPPSYFDANGDNAVQPDDALTVIDFLNADSTDNLALSAVMARDVPEPSTFALAAVAIVGLGTLARRRRLG